LTISPRILPKPISLEKLAGVSGFSSFYFHRIFTALTGETPADYVLRTRLELAENYLIKTRRSITQIALECGFSNSAVFARTFRQKCGITPSQYRAGVPAQRAQTGERAQPPTEVNFSIEAVTIQNLPPIPAIYMACYEGYDINLICRAWEKLYRWAALHHLDLSQSRAIGLSLDDPHITLRHQCRYYACFSVEPPAAPSSPVNQITIAAVSMQFSALKALPKNSVRSITRSSMIGCLTAVTSQRTIRHMRSISRRLTSIPASGLKSKSAFQLSRFQYSKNCIMPGKKSKAFFFRKKYP
jgi:AraC family transcriptional regulator